MKILKASVFVLIVLIILLFATRFTLPRQIDDVNPYMNCTKNELNRADVFYVVPIFEGIPINESKEWCEKILALNKTIYLHGIYHTYREFGSDVEFKDFKEGVEIFKDCFGFYPKQFKAPQLVFAKENQWLLDFFDLNIDSNINQLFHKVYHCNDSGAFSNSFHDWF